MGDNVCSGLAVSRFDNKYGFCSGLELVAVAVATAVAVAALPIPDDVPAPVLVLLALAAVASIQRTIAQI